MPTAGQSLKIEDVQMILDAVQARKNNFPQEPDDITWTLVLLNIGERYRSVACIEGEWVGKKQDIPKPEMGAIPTCPNGHPLLQAENGITIGWVTST